MKSFARLLIFSISIFSVSGFFSSPAYAIRDRTLMFRSATYGLIGGVGIGVLTYPFAKSTNTIIAGAAVGLALGLVFGEFRIQERRSEEEEAVEERRESYGMRLRPDPVLMARAPSPQGKVETSPVQFEGVFYRF